MGSGKVLLGVLAGVAAGATLGILFAPDKGSSTRKKISRKSDDYADELEEKFHEFLDSITAKYETVKGEVLHEMTGDGHLKHNDAEEEVKAAAR